jgi:MFS family permease
MMKEMDDERPAARGLSCCLNLPTKQMFILSTTLFSSCLGITMIFPFLPFQVESFGVAASHKEVGYYAGMLGSTYMIARAVSSIPWGLVADRYGRRVVLFSSLYLMAALVLAYGFCTSLGPALAVRALTGLCNGILGPGKALASEICAPDEATQARSMTIVMTAFR